MYLCIVSIAIVISFHFKHGPSELEKRLSLPLGICFWVLSLACLFAGLGNYIKTSVPPCSPPYIFWVTNKCVGWSRIRMYSKKAALVQSGPKTQLVSSTYSRIFPRNGFASRYFTGVQQIPSLRGTGVNRSKRKSGLLL